MAAFAIAAFVLVALMFSLATAVATAQTGLVRRLRMRTRQVKRTGGLVLIAAGVWLVVLSVWADFFAQFWPR
jgi:cytochrome c biogenesis protein CcdA